jgi:hypothetical protein
VARIDRSDALLIFFLDAVKEGAGGGWTLTVTACVLEGGHVVANLQSSVIIGMILLSRNSIIYMHLFIQNDERKCKT